MSWDQQVSKRILFLKKLFGGCAIRCLSLVQFDIVSRASIIHWTVEARYRPQITNVREDLTNDTVQIVCIVQYGNEPCLIDLNKDSDVTVDERVSFHVFLAISEKLKISLTTKFVEVHKAFSLCSQLPTTGGQPRNRSNTEKNNKKCITRSYSWYALESWSCYTVPSSSSQRPWSVATLTFWEFTDRRHKEESILLAAHG